MNINDKINLKGKEQKKKRKINNLILLTKW